MNQKSRLHEETLLLSALKDRLRTSPEAEFLHRLHCITLINRGFSCGQIARWFGHTTRTVERWLRDFRTEGVDGLHNGRKPGRTPRLDSMQTALLRLHLSLSPADFGLGKAEWDGSVLAEHIRQTFGVVLGIRQCQRLLRNIGRPAPMLEEVAVTPDFASMFPASKQYEAA